MNHARAIEGWASVERRIRGCGSGDRSVIVKKEWNKCYFSVACYLMNGDIHVKRWNIFDVANKPFLFKLREHLAQFTETSFLGDKIGIAGPISASEAPESHLKSGESPSP